MTDFYSSVFEQVERTRGHDGTGWVVYRIARV
jgi:hypothetical protein